MSKIDIMDARFFLELAAWALLVVALGGVTVLGVWTMVL